MKVSGRQHNRKLQTELLNAEGVSHRHHLPLGWHISWSVADAEFGLERVEVDLQLALLLDFGGLVHTAIVTEVLQLSPHGHHSLFWGLILEPGRSTIDPL